MPIGDDVLEIRGNTASAVTALENLDVQLQKLNETSQAISAELVKGFSQAEKEIQTTSNSVGLLATAMGGAMVAAQAAIGIMKAGFSAVVGTIKEVVEAGAQAETTAKKLDVAWENASKRIGLTRREMDAFAESLGKTAAIDDDVLKDLEARLLTFDQIGRDNFLRVLPVALNTAANSGRSLETTMESLGRALQDPAHNVSAISNNVVSLSAATKELAKDLAEAGDIVGAQNVILAELEARTKGGAAAAATTFAAAQSRAAIAVNELYEKIAVNLLPAFTDFLNDVGRAVDEVGLLLPNIIELSKQFGNVALAALGFNGTMDELPSAVEVVRTAIASCAIVLNNWELLWVRLGLQVNMVLEDVVNEFNKVNVAIDAAIDKIQEWFDVFMLGAKGADKVEVGGFALKGLEKAIESQVQKLDKGPRDAINKIVIGMKDEFAKLEGVADDGMSLTQAKIQQRIAEIDKILMDSGLAALTPKGAVGPNVAVPVPAPGSDKIPPAPPKKKTREQLAEERKEQKELWKQVGIDMKNIGKGLFGFGPLVASFQKPGDFSNTKEAIRARDAKEREEARARIKDTDKGFQSEAVDLIDFATKLQTAALSEGKNEEKRAAIEAEKHLKEIKDTNKRLFEIFTKQPEEAARRLAAAMGPQVAAAYEAAAAIANPITELVKKIPTLPARAG